MDSRQVALILIGAGSIAILLGVLAYFGLLSWFGRLPGDIRIEGENASFSAPIVSMLLISAGLSIGLALFRRLF